MIACPECLRTFSHVLDEDICLVQETGCTYCSSLIQYAIVQPALPQALPRKSGARMPTPFRVVDLNQCKQE
jgi:hypothetical protein